ncbi:MAG: hypothetical protein U0470_00090 [Anaerolineae bacterium]
MLASANRDPGQFPDPDTSDSRATRTATSPSASAPTTASARQLARLEAQIAIRMLVERAPGLRLAVAPEAVRWRKGMVLRG